MHYLYSSGDREHELFAEILERRINTLGEARELLYSNLSGLKSNSKDTQINRLINSLNFFSKYEKNCLTDFDYSDCAIGNLILAGLYIQNNSNFQKAVSEFSGIFNTKIGLFTVSNDNSVSLVAITSNQEFLAREHLIVNGLYTGAVVRLGFIDSVTLGNSDLFYSGIRNLEDLERIQNFFIEPRPGPEAVERLINADLLCYLPGTQNSSLYPSYQILRNHIQKSNALTKVLVMNLTRDHDMANWKRSDILVNALVNLGDPENLRKCITHVLLNSPSNDASLLDGPIKTVCEKFDIKLISKKLSMDSMPSVHSGDAVVDTLRNLL